MCAIFPTGPQIESLQLVIQMGFTNERFNLCAALPWSQAFWIVGNGISQISSLGYMLLELRNIDLVISIRGSVIVDEIIGLFLIGYQSGHAFQHEVQVIGAHGGVCGYTRSVKLLERLEQTCDRIGNVLSSTQRETRGAAGA